MDDIYNQLKALRLEDDYQTNLRDKLIKLAAPKPKKSDIELYEELKVRNPELGAIAMIESSGGQNYGHSLDPRSGMTAGGMFGMMPFTASDVVRLDKNLAKKYPQIVEKTKDLKNQHSEITKFFNENPEAAIEFAESHYNRARKRLGDPNKAAYSWYRGITNAVRDQNIPGKIESHDYVKKFKSLLENPKIVLGDN